MQKHCITWVIALQLGDKSIEFTS